MKKSPDKHVRFGVRLSPGDAIQLEAIACRLGITKSQVLRLSLSSENSLKPAKTDAGNAAASDALDAIFSRMSALDERLQNMQSLLSGAVDLLLSMSRTAQQNAQSAPRQPEPVPIEKPQTPAGPKWSDYVRKNYKTSPIMSDADWAEFLKKRYAEQHGFPPDLST